MPQIDIKLQSTADVSGFQKTSVQAQELQRIMAQFGNRVFVPLDNGLQLADRAIKGKLSDWDRTINSVGKKFTLPDIGKQFLGGLGIGSGLAVAERISELIAGHWERAAKAAEQVAVNSDRRTAAVLGLISQNQTQEQQLNVMLQNRARLERQIAEARAAGRELVKTPEMKRAPEGGWIESGRFTTRERGLSKQENKNLDDLETQLSEMAREVDAFQKVVESEKISKQLSLADTANKNTPSKFEMQYEGIEDAQARGAAALAAWNEEMTAAAQKFKEVAAPAEEYRRKMEEVADLERFGKLTAEEAAASRKRLLAELNDTAGKAITAARTELQKFDAALAKIDANESLTKNEKHRERLKILNDQEAAIQRLKKALEEFAAANPGLANAAIGSEIQALGTKLSNNERDREAPPTAIERARTGYRSSQEEGFQNAGEGVEGGILGWMASVGTMADQLADGIRNTLGTAVDAITEGIMNWDGTGRGALLALGNIGNAIFRAMLQQLVQMGATWLINQALVKTGMISLDVLADAQRAARVAKENAAEAATLPMKTAGAAASGISSFGGALIFGALAIALIASIAGGFADGGFTAKGARTKPAGIVHAGEWVAPQWMVDSPVVGPLIASLESMRTGSAGYAVGGMVDALSYPGYAIERPRYEPQGSVENAFGSANGEAQSLRPNMIVLFDPQQYARMMQENSRDWFFDMANEHRRKS